MINDDASSPSDNSKKQKLDPKVPKYLTMSKINGVSPSKILAKSVTLTREQNQILEMIKKGRSVFFTGSAGTGKSFLLKKIIGMNYFILNCKF